MNPQCLEMEEALAVARAILLATPQTLPGMIPKNEP
jgi:hypothetical protein